MKSFREHNKRNKIVNKDEEIPHCPSATLRASVRNDFVSHYMGMGISSGEAAAYSHPPSPSKRPSFRPQGEISFFCASPAISTTGRNLLRNTLYVAKREIFLKMYKCRVLGELSVMDSPVRDTMLVKNASKPYSGVPLGTRYISKTLRT